MYYIIIDNQYLLLNGNSLLHLLKNKIRFLIYDCSATELIGQMLNILSNFNRKFQFKGYLSVNDEKLLEASIDNHKNY